MGHLYHGELLVITRGYMASIPIHGALVHHGTMGPFVSTAPTSPINDQPLPHPPGYRGKKELVQAVDGRQDPWWIGGWRTCHTNI